MTGAPAAPGEAGELSRCWAEIGVWGPEGGTCPELVEHVHCRNCPVFAAAGHQVFRRAPPEGYEEANARALQQPETHAELSDAAALVFRVGDELLALSAGDVVEVRDVDERGLRVHPLPHQSPHGLLGLVNVRGQLLPCVSLPLLLGIAEATVPTSEADGPPRLLVFGTADAPLAAPVRAALGVRRYRRGRLAAAPPTLDGTGLLQGALDLDGRTVGLLDGQALVTIATACLRP